VSDAPPPSVPSFESFSRSHLFRVRSLGALVLLLQIPVGLVGSLIIERELRRADAVAEITRKWGGRQHNEDHALLVGATGLFAVLALVMWLTRRVDWFERAPWPPLDAASGRGRA